MTSNKIAIALRQCLAVTLAVWPAWGLAQELEALSTAEEAAPPAATAPLAGAQPPTPGAKTSLGGGLNPDMKLDELVNQDVLVPALRQVVNTVDRQESTVGRSPAAVFVITQDMIRRSGVRSVPEALRMAPGIEVAKIDSSTWAISARGFNGRFANKLLVQIDRRVVYTPTFGGVYWDVQDLVLADVDRIEVIRGPGTTAWGSNAVNGVINIITKKSQDTQGVLIQNGGGNQELDFNTVRYGGKSGEDLSWRAWGQQFDRNSGWSTTGVDDAWRQQRGGFRADWTPTKEHTVTVQGDIYNGYDGEMFSNTIPTFPYSEDVSDMVHVSGGDVLMRVGRVMDEETSWQVQSYYDRYRRNFTAFAETRDTFDLDFQYQFSPWEFHQFIAGANYRNSADVTQGGFSFNMVPPNFTTQWASVFAEDTMALIEDKLYFTLGTRLEQNTYGHFQVEPTARLLILPSPRQSLWVAVSRAVRNPTRLDANGSLVTRGAGLPGPIFYNFQGNPNIQPENLMAYEVGYRAAPTDKFSWDIATYINAYEKLQGFGPPGTPFIPQPGVIFIPVQYENNTRALSYGFETTATYQMTERLRLFGSYSVFEVHAQGPDPFTNEHVDGNTPHNQVYLRSSLDLGNNVEFDVIGRYVDQVTALSIPKYIEMDSRIGWRPRPNIEFSFVGQNLLNPHHLEYTDYQTGIISTQVRRGYYGMVSLTY